LNLESWILILDSWFLKSTFLLNLEVFLILSWISWTHSLIDLWAFCHHLCHHLCYHQIIFESLLIHHEALFLQPVAKIVFKKLSTEFTTFQLISKWCNRLQWFGNRLLVCLNVEIQIQMWRVTSFHKNALCNRLTVISSEQKSKDVTLPMIFKFF